MKVLFALKEAEVEKKVTLPVERRLIGMKLEGISDMYERNEFSLNPLSKGRLVF